MQRASVQIRNIYQLFGGFTKLMKVGPTFWHKVMLSLESQFPVTISELEGMERLEISHNFSFDLHSLDCFEHNHRKVFINGKPVKYIFDSASFKFSSSRLSRKLPSGKQKQIFLKIHRKVYNISEKTSNRRNLCLTSIFVKLQEIQNKIDRLCDIHKFG